MGEYTEEAIQAGLCEDYRKEKYPIPIIIIMYGKM